MGLIIRTFTSDSSPNINFTITRTDGSIVNLSGCTVRFIIENPYTHLVTNNPSGLITNVCTITNAVSGQCTYTWNKFGTDIPIAGLYPANLKIEYSTGAEETYELLISVEDSIMGAVVS